MTYTFKIIGPGDAYGPADRGYVADEDDRHTIEVRNDGVFVGFINDEVVERGMVQLYRYPDPCVWFALEDVAEIVAEVRKRRYDIALAEIETRIDALRSIAGTPVAQLRGIGSERWIGKDRCRAALEVAKTAVLRRYLDKDTYEYFDDAGATLLVTSDCDTHYVIQAYATKLHGFRWHIETLFEKAA